jgi:hypothetical protein
LGTQLYGPERNVAQWMSLAAARDYVRLRGEKGARGRCGKPGP